MLHKYLWRKVSHHDTDTFIRFDSKKSKEPRKQRQYPSVGKVLHKLELPTHILHSRGFSAVQLTKPWEKKTLLRQDHSIIVIRADKNPPRQKDVQLTNTVLKKKRLSETKPASPFLHCIIGSSVEKENCLVFSVF